ncbi:anti-phage protein KwaB [Pseudoalteromonas peptidolytica]|uniref:anti-phage protein KwaB n=1 Tax=Pseudoalteromonas peptidolytica TaxID=61150 RepID=UPI00298DF7AE|nr:anti-phage protein KwaB [Pseudoalteromonas peptidolytica]MDW7549826.1 anti-phage protein KwaB [Pseudoalteromonas peptidolytica]
MNKEDLSNKLEYFSNNIEQIGVTVYVVLKNENNPKKLDIRGEDLPAIKTLFVESLHDTIVADENLQVVPLSTSDDRINVIYEYDIEIPEKLQCMQSVVELDNHKPFDLENDEINTVSALVIALGNETSQVVLYKTMAQVNIYGRSSFFLKKSSQRFEELKEEFFRISPNFQFFRIDDSLLVVDLKTLEKSFGFHEVIEKEALMGVEAVEQVGLLENPEVLHELVDDITTARKLTKVAKASPVLRANIDNSQIIAFCKTFPSLKGKMRFNASGDKIQLDTKVSKNLFIQLLMDDFLTSELTQFHYTSLAKDAAEEPVAESETEE